MGFEDGGYEGECEWGLYVCGIGSLIEMSRGRWGDEGLSGVGGVELRWRVGVKVFGREGGIWVLDWNLRGREK